MSATHSLSLASASSQYASIADASSPNIDITGSQTWECWVNLISVTAQQHFLGGIRASGGGNFKGFWFGTTPEVNFSLSGLTTNETVTANIQSGFAGQWNHIAGVYNGSTLKSYINGEEVASVAASGSSGAITASFSIGRLGDQAVNHTNGRIRNFRIWNVARTQTQIRDNMNINTPTGTGLQGNWILNNAYTDSSGNGYTLTASGSPVFSTTYPDAINLTENGAFLAKHKIAIDHTKVAGSSNLTDFPVVFTESNFLPAVFNNTQGQEINTNALKSDSSLKAYYRFESGALTTDSSTGGFTLTNNNTVASGTGIFGGACDFGTGNTNKYLNVNNDMGITSGAITISLWVKPNSTPSGGASTTLFERGDSSTNTRHWIRYNDASGTIQLSYNRQRENVANDAVTYNVTLSTSVYTHLVLSYDGTTVRAYFNGASVGSIASSGNGASGVDIDYTYIGCGRSQLSPFFFNFANALIDDVAVFNRGLSAEEVRSLYAGGQDLRFSTDIAGKTRLAHEVVSWNTVNKTGEVWVKINELDHNDNTNLYVHYKNATASALNENEAFGKHQVWGENWEGVWHLTGVTDSTKNSVDLTAVNTPTTTTGKLGGGFDFVAASSQYLTNTTPTALRFSGNKTMIAWLDPDTIGTQTYPLGLWNSSPNNYYQFFLDTNSKFTAQVGGSGSQLNNSSALTNNTWFFLGLILTAGTNLKAVLNNNIATNSSISGETAQNAGGFSIGRTGSYTLDYFDGQIDNVMIYNGALSDDYIKTLYDNQNSPATFARPISAGGAFLLQFV